ncbi:MAG: response regulator [Bacteroidota bacterium]
MPGIFMLVDDDQDDRFLFGEAMEMVDGTIHYVSSKSGKEAIEWLSTSANLPDLIFLDINMPEMTGWECLRQLKLNTETKQLPVIMYSTSSHDRDIKLSKELGALTFCIKPDNFDDMISLLSFFATNLRKDLSTEIRKSKHKLIRWKN